jgi:hypothetical protein
MPISILNVLDYALPFAAAFLLAWEWRRSAALGRKPVLLIIVAISCSWLLLALTWRGAFGPDYSNTHFAICCGNLLADVGTAILAIALRPQRAFRVAIAALCLAWVWFFALSIMYVV